MRALVIAAGAGGGGMDRGECAEFSLSTWVSCNRVVDVHLVGPTHDAHHPQDCLESMILGSRDGQYEELCQDAEGVARTVVTIADMWPVVAVRGGISGGTFAPSSPETYTSLTETVLTRCPPFITGPVMRQFPNGVCWEGGGGGSIKLVRVTLLS